MQEITGQELISEITLSDIEASVGSDITFCACVHKLRKIYFSISLFSGYM